ncbi:MAG: hypothetical protein HRT45_06695 [Bdellovibrionales bacterium]|nr:hypothetical protein [Bdellovibrionales bacterium]
MKTAPNFELSKFFKSKRDIIISKVIQGTFFAVDEQGIEAAAATALVGRAGAGPRKEEPIELDFDKPFVFMLYSTSLGRVVMAGEIWEPEFN